MFLSDAGFEPMLIQYKRFQDTADLTTKPLKSMFCIKTTIFFDYDIKIGEISAGNPASYFALLPAAHNHVN